MTEFKLSEKINENYYPDGMVSVDDIKEFIKRLKEEIKRGVTRNKVFPLDWCFDSIDKLAGDDLI